MVKPSSPTPEFSGLPIEIGMLRRERRYTEIVALTDSVPTQLLSATPALMLARAGSLSHLRRHGEALAVLIEAEPAVHAVGDHLTITTWQLQLAIQLIHAGQLTVAANLLQDTIASAATHNFLGVLADAYNSLGVCLSFRGDVDEAILLFKRSLISWQGLGEARGSAFANHNIGLVLREWGDPWKAEPYLQQADTYYQSEGIVEERVSILAERSILYSDLGDERLAKSLAHRSVTESSTLLSAAVRASALRAVGIIACRFDSVDSGEAALLQALEVLGNEQGGLLRGEILEELAVVALQQGSPMAGSRLNEAVAAYRKIGSVRHCEKLYARLRLDPPEQQSRRDGS